METVYVIEYKGLRVCSSFESYHAAWNFIVRKNLRKPNGVIADGFEILEKFAY
jgi:hypothetical protein